MSPEVLGLLTLLACAALAVPCLIFKGTRRTAEITIMTLKPVLLVGSVALGLFIGYCLGIACVLVGASLGVVQLMSAGPGTVPVWNETAILLILYAPVVIGTGAGLWLGYRVLYSREPATFQAGLEPEVGS